MRVNKAKNPPQSVRYLLCADRKLQRISLKRISERLKKPKQPPRSGRQKNSVGAANSRPFPLAIRSRAIVLGVIVVVAAVVVITARQPSQRADLARADVAPAANAPMQNAPGVARLETKKTVVAKAPAAAAAARTSAADVSMAKTPAVASVKTPPVESAVETPAVQSAPKAAAVASTGTPNGQTVPAVTITGCVERDEDAFWLKDTTGVDAPMSRSWKSGFLRKRASRIMLVDATNTQQLPNYVGQRVAATGVFSSREMHAHLLRPVAASCN